MEKASQFRAPGERVTMDRQLLRAATFIDLRAPVEFARGALPGAVSLPLMTDSEREQVGTAYVQQGKEAALALGHQLVSGQVRDERLRGWLAHLQENPAALLFCARGGLRSQTVQSWLREAGVVAPRVAGGFKAIRQVCVDALAEAPTKKPILVVGGRTGCGKTAILAQIPGSLDLERIANHRSSAFGEFTTPQPKQIGFENALAIDYLRHDHPTLVMEDESRSIGHVALPLEWYEAMRDAPTMVVECEMAERCRRIEEEYVFEPLRGDFDPQALQARLAGAVTRIQKRLGRERHAEVLKLMGTSFKQGDHAPWIERLLSWYYDPAYDRHLQSKKAQVVWRGSVEEAPAVAAALSQAM